MTQKMRVALVELVVSLLSSAIFAQSYPQSEWDYAKVILMHTPGEELFDGVIHPYAGLFEYYFDVAKALSFIALR